MIIGIPKERRDGERRVAASPDTVKRLLGLGHAVVVERGAGAGAAFTDDAYTAVGARMGDDAAALGAEIVLKVQRPTTDELKAMKSGTVLIGMLAPLQHKSEVEAYAKAGLIAFALELVPRITRAQAIDVLSSQANLAGYKAVLEAAEHFGRAIPMMMTAAGTVPPARVLVMGAGVAGLQAIATARRLGGVVSATDVRYAAKEHVESLGASFLVVDLEAMKAMETQGGYAKEASADFTRRQRTHITEALKKTDIVICTALVPGHKAPILLTKEMIDIMRTGSVIVDLAVEQGGNVEGSKPDEIVTTANGITIIGYTNMPARVAMDASALYARNLFAFLGLILDKDKALKIDEGDQIVKASLLTRDGRVVNPQLAGA